MRSLPRYLAIIFLISLHLTNAAPSSLTISRSRSHEDKSGKYTPLVVSLSTEDKAEKIKPVDLICIVDVSGSMSGSPITLVKESLEYLVKLMNSTDNFALVTFSSSSEVVNGLTPMTEENKEKILLNIHNLDAYGGTNIFSGLEKGLELIKQDYSSGERVASMILLSDGYDNYYYGTLTEGFRDLLISENKSDYAFTLHSFGYGDSHDYELLNEIALIKDGAYFNIKKLQDVGESFLTIYGSLSTVMDINIQLKIQSKYDIVSVYGMEDMYEANITNETISSFNVKLIQVIYGRKYDFVLLVDIPKTTPTGTEVLNATVSKLGLKAKYLWDGKFSPPAYEEYIRCIVVIIFIEGYQLGGSMGINKIDEEIEWMKKNYNGTRNWVKELNDAKDDLSSSYYGGNANLLSKITELKTSRIGIHYDEGNSYQRTLISNYHGLDISTMEKFEIKGEIIINFIENINYYYFYLKKGNGEINNMPISGESSSLIIYSDDYSGNIKLKSLSDSMECYSFNKTTERIQAIVDFNHVGKFIIKKNFPYDFYTRVDGKRDITFNIEFLKFDYDKSNMENISDFLIIYAYILTDDDIDNLVNNEYYLSRFESFKGIFDHKNNIGKLVIKQEDITVNLNSRYNNYLYITIIKNEEYNITISDNVEGQFFFIPNNYIYSSVPENYKIFSNLEQGESSPHLYTLEIDPLTINNLFIIEIESIDNDELDYKILNYQNYVDGIIEQYVDYNEYVIERKKDSNKIYLNVTQNRHGVTFNKIILSIFSTNKDHIPTSNLSYIFKYTTDYREMPVNTDLSELALLNETFEIETTKPVITKIKVIILGFAKYTYIRNNKIISFFMYFVYVKKVTYAKRISINVNIKYKSSKRFLQDSSAQKGVCTLDENDSDKQKRYNCTIETNGEEIENIQIDKDIKAEDEEIDFSDTEISPMGIKYMDKLQDVGDNDPFDKKLYILQNSSITVDNDNNEFIITGDIDDSEFNYDKMTLEIGLLDGSQEKVENIDCRSKKEENNTYNLQCTTKNKMNGKINSAFANLGKENLLVDISDSEKKNINFQEKSQDITGKRYYNKSSGGLTAGGVAAIIIPSIIVVLGLIALIIYLARVKGTKTEEPNSSVAYGGSSISRI